MKPEIDKPTHQIGHSEALVYLNKLREENARLRFQAEAQGGAKLSAAVERIHRQNVQGMADCMDMVHGELIEAGIIDKKTPPMMVANAVCAHIAELHTAAAAVVARWDTPMWKHETHTAVFIDRLRKALGNSSNNSSSSNSPEIEEIAAQGNSYKKRSSSNSNFDAAQGQQEDESACIAWAERFYRNEEWFDKTELAIAINTWHHACAYARTSRTTPTVPAIPGAKEDAPTLPYCANSYDDEKVVCDECSLTLGQSRMLAAWALAKDGALRYTCIGKGGAYEVIGEARGAGTLKSSGRVRVYRDAVTGGMFYRSPSDFDERMQLLSSVEKEIE